MGNAEACRRDRELIAEPPAGRMRHGHVGHQAGLEEAFDAREGAVDELIDDDNGARRQILLERTAGAHGKYLGDAGHLEGADIGAVIEVGGRAAMAAPVPRQEYHLLAVQLAEQQLVGGVAKGGRDLAPGLAREAVQIVNPRAADDTDHRGRSCVCRHPLSPKAATKAAAGSGSTRMSAAKTLFQNSPGSLL